MKTIWVHRDIFSPSTTLWALLTELDRWPQWGPTVRRAVLVGDRLEKGARGTVTTVFGVRLPFEITAYDEGTRWAWRVAGVQATDHTVTTLGPERCRVGFGVPWPAAPYLAVCRVALDRLESIAIHDRVAP
ncbi:MAG: SRPBCC family protein [Acidimicrobiales bacterium]